MSTSYTIKASPLARGGWAVVVEGIGGSRVFRLEQAKEEMRSALSEITGQDMTQAQFFLEVELPSQLIQDLRTVEHGHAEAERLLGNA